MFHRALLVLEPDNPPDALIQSGLAMARACHAEVVFCTAMTRTRFAVADLRDPKVAAPGSSQDDQRFPAELLHAQARQLADRQGVSSRSVTATGNDPVRSIIDAALVSNCDLIVVASEKSNAFVRLVNGSFMPGLVTASPVPVMVCARQPRQGSALSADTHRILVLLEDSDTVDAARALGTGLAQALRSQLLFAHVMPAALGPVVDAAGMVSTVDDRLGAEIQLQSQRLLASTCRVAARSGLTSRCKSLAAGMTAREIAHMALDEACDLIVLAHRGGNAVMRLLTGSRIPGLITAATVPVLICRATSEPPKRSTPRRRHRRHRGAAAAAAAHAAHLHAR